MKTILRFVISLMLVSCSNDDNNPKKEATLSGSWKLIEQLTDPGDGSGDFKPVNSYRTIQFFDDGRVESNGSLCFITTDVGETNTGVYIEKPNDFSDGEITSEKCGINGPKIYYNLDGEYLILWYQCIEGCAQKFIKK